MAQHSTPDPDATMATGTFSIDLTQFAEQVARLVIRGLVAREAHEDAGRYGEYVEGLDHHAPPTFGEHQAMGHGDDAGAQR